MKNETKHLELIDHLRGVAILAVLVLHTLGMAFGYDALPWKGWWRDFSGQTSFLYFLPLGMVSQAGVAIFFAVSGFCIHLSFETQGKRWDGFFVRRFFRIYPPYFLALLFSVVLLVISPGVDFFSRDFWRQGLSHLLLVHNLDPATNFGVNAALWSLAVEAQLYLLYPLLLWLVGRSRWTGALGLLAVGEILIRGLAGVSQTVGAPNLFVAQLSTFLADSPLGYWFSWAIGAAIADAWLRQKPLPFANASPLFWLGLACGCHFVRPLQVFQFMLFAVAAAVVMARGLSGKIRPLKWPPGGLGVLRKIGLWSYSIYLLHQPLLHVYSHVIVWAVPAERRPAPIAFGLLLVTWLVIIALCALWYELIERPGIALGKRIILAGVRPEPESAETPVLPSAAGSGRRRPAAVTGLMFVLLGALLAASLFISYEFSVRAALRRGERAWVLATSAESARRNGARAVQLAEDACLQTQYRQPGLIATLAAAYAEAGRFDEAIGAAQTAGKMAAQAGDETLRQRCDTMLAAFWRHEPYRETPAAAP